MTLVTARGEHGHPPAVPRGTSGTAPSAAAGNRDSTGPTRAPGLPAPVPGVPNRRGGKRPRLLAPGQRTRPGRAHPWARGHRSGRTPLPKNTPGHFLRRGRGRKGLSSNLETRRSGLHPALLFLLLLTERGHGPLHPRGGCHGLGAPRTPSLPRGTTGHPAPFPGLRHPRAPRAFPGALRAFPGARRIFSRGTPQPFPSPEHPRAPRIFPQGTRTPRHPAPLPGISRILSRARHIRTPCTPHSDTGPGHSAPLSGHPWTPHPRGRRWMGGWRGAPAAPRGAEPRIGRCGGA